MPNLRLISDRIAEGGLIPCSFALDEAPSGIRLSSAKQDFYPGDDWSQPSWHRLVIDYAEDSDSVDCKLSCAFDPSYTMVRLTIELHAKGDSTPRISNIRILDLNLTETGNASPELYGLTGGFHSQFPPECSKLWSVMLEPGREFVLDSDGSGRSSNSQMPIWLLNIDGERGLWFGPEWSGCWNMSASRSEGLIRVTVGLPTFDFTMRKCEWLRLPTAAFGFYCGKPADGFNALRRTIYTNYLPFVSGEKPHPLVYFQGYGGHPAYQDESTMYCEANRAAEIGCEAFVLDGGWNNPPNVPQEQWSATVGDWEDCGRFPGGVREFGEYVKSKGMRFGIWLEPRAAQGTPLAEQYPHLFAGTLAALWKPEGERMFIEVLEHLINDFGADFIWLDYNIDARTVVWDPLEEPDRKGLMELGFYQGWYRAVETVIRRHLNVWIESCSSGGRIMDLAQLRVSHSIWVNDQPVWANYPPDTLDSYNRNVSAGLNHVLPAACIQTSIFLESPIWQVQPAKGTRLGGGHRFLSFFGGSFGFGQGLCFWHDDDIRLAAEYAAVFKEYRSYLEGHYYQLLPLPSSLDAWDARQYHDPETGSGIALIFRLEESANERMDIHLKAIDPINIELTRIAGNGSIQSTENGLLLVEMDAPGAVMVYYERSRP